MSDELYRAGHRTKRVNKRRRRLIRLSILVIIIVLLVIAGLIIKSHLKPKTQITQSRPITSHVSYGTKSKHYDEPDFGIDLPSNWQPEPRPVGPYQSYSWQVSDNGSKGQEIEIFEDVIPVNYAVNRALIVEGQTDHVLLQGSASDECSTFTKNIAPGPNGVQAKFNGVDFLCDQNNQERDSIGTSSADGVNTVVLRSPGTGKSHKFFFTYTNHAINPDYSLFYNAISSFKML